MTFVKFISSTAWLGYALGGALVVVGVAVLVSFIFHRRDDGFRPIDEPQPPTPRRSPFAPDAAFIGAPVTGVGKIEVDGGGEVGRTGEGDESDSSGG